MSAIRALALALLVVGASATVSAQPFVYVGTSGSQSPFSVCFFSGTCESSTVELRNVTTSTALKTHSFGVAGLGGYRFGEVVAAPDGRRVYAITREGVMAIDVLEGRTTKVGNETGGGLAISPDGARLYFVNGTVLRVIDTVSLSDAGAISLSADAWELAVSPDGAYLYAAQLLPGTVSKISTASQSVVGTFAVREPSALAISPDNSRLYVVSMGRQTVTVLDASSGTPLAVISTTLPIGSFTTGAIVATAATAFVSDLGDSKVLFIDAGTNTVARTVSVVGAAGLALSSDQRELYVAGQTGVMRLDATTGAVLGSFPTASPAINVASLPPVSCLYESTLAPAAVPLGGGTQVLTIPAPASCSWGISSAADWVAPASASGVGHATVGLAVAAATAPRTGTIQIGAQDLRVLQTSPEVHSDLSGPLMLTGPATVTGWAIDRDSSAVPTSSPGIDAVHVWAYPLPSGLPVFVGAATYGADRNDVAAMYGARYRSSGFSVIVRGLRAGTYNLAFFAHSSRSGAFAATALLPVVIQRAPPRIVIDGPGAGANVTTPFAIAGWAIDPAAGTGTGIDAVHVWAYPSSGAPQFLGAATYGVARPDVGQAFGSAFTTAGFGLLARGLAPGAYQLAVFAHSSDTGVFGPAALVPVTVTGSTPVMYVDVPAAGATISGTFSVDGWAVDLGAATGSGVDAIHVWAYPGGGGAPRFVGAASPTSRPDVAQVFGSQSANSGFHLDGASLPPGIYDLVVFARSTVTSTFNNSFVVRIVVQ